MSSTVPIEIPREILNITHMTPDELKREKDAARKLTGAKRRAFQAQVTLDYLGVVQQYSCSLIEDIIVNDSALSGMVVSDPTDLPQKPGVPEQLSSRESGLKIRSDGGASRTQPPEVGSRMFAP